MIDTQSIFRSQGIDPYIISRVDAIDDGDYVIIWGQIQGSHQDCPFCKSKNTVIKEYKVRKIKGLKIGVKNVEIDIRVPRYCCKDCKKTFTYDTSTFTANKITKGELNEIILNFGQMITFSDIARLHNMSISEVIHLFDQYCPWLNEPIGEVICIDEFKNSGIEDIAKYACILVNFATHKIIDILPSRTLNYLREYFSKQPYSIRCSIKYVITDMYDGYITIAKEYLPNATIAIDPFHYIRYFTEAVQSIRIRKFADEDFYARDLRWMKQNWRLLTVNLYEKKYQEKTIELSSGETISIYDRVFRFVKQDSELLYAVTALQDYYFMAAQTTYETADSLIKFTINRLKNSNIKELIDCAGTREHYEQYIVNSFIKYKGKRLSNGPIEGINSRIKALKKIYCGYSNFKRFFKRVIYIINKQKENSQKQNSKKL